MALKHILGNLPVIRILDFLIDHKGYDYPKKDIAEGAGIGSTDMKRGFPDLVKCGVVVETRRIGGVRLYALDLENTMTQSLISLDYDLTEYCMKTIDEGLDEEYGEGLPEPED